MSDVNSNEWVKKSWLEWWMDMDDLKQEWWRDVECRPHTIGSFPPDDFDRLPIWFQVWLIFLPISVELISAACIIYMLFFL